jgi:TetR/AcrR family transcriptional repressor of nem operon
MPKVSHARDKILDAAVSVVRAKGFAATSIDDLCAAAGVTKGAFFHHFPSKEALGVDAARHWATTTSAVFAAQGYHALPDPLERVLAYLTFRRAILDGPLGEITCLAGTMVQEAHETSRPIAAACDKAIDGHAEVVAADIAAAMRARGLEPDGRDTGWSAKSLALHTQVVLQGAFVLAKAKGGNAIAMESVDHLTRYVRFLFQTAAKGKIR